MKDWPLKNQVKPGYLQGVWHPGLGPRQHSTNLTGVEEKYLVLVLLIMLTVQAAKLVLKLITFQLSICDCGVWPPTTVRAVIIIDI